VSGKIHDTQVKLVNAEFDGQLALFEGRGWGFEPSLLIFLFVDKNTLPENREFVITESGNFEGTTPHVHYRWRDVETEKIETDVASQKYEMRLAFGKATEGVLPGTIEFSVPGEATSVQGAFEAKLKK
jgi:hypothetical protein